MLPNFVSIFMGPFLSCEYFHQALSIVCTFLQPSRGLHTSQYRTPETTCMKTMPAFSFSRLVPLLFIFPLLQAQPPRPNGINKDALDPIDPNSPKFRNRENQICNASFRTLDGTCSSVGSRLQQLWGSTNRPHFSYFGRSSIKPVGMDRPSPRLISNALCKQSRSTNDERGLSEMTTFFGQFIDHTIVATPLSERRADRLDIIIPRNDPVMANFTNGRLPFSRSERVKVSGSSRVERPQNSLSSVVDLASVYGPDSARSRALRAGKLGLLTTSGPNLLPLNTGRINNAPVLGRKFFLAGDHRANEHPVLTSLHTIFMREHNDIAKELSVTFPTWNDEQVYQNARHINIAQMQKIVFEEWYPAITGRKLPAYRGFKRNVDPTVSVVFSTAAFRIGHTMVGNEVNRVGRGKKKMAPFDFKSMLFTGTSVIKSQGIEDFLRGALLSNAQRIDLQVTDALRNFLFTNVKGEEGFDLIALNLQRCRDHACPSYKEIRQFFLKGRSGTVRKFSDITKNRNVQSALQSVYEKVDKIDPWIGLMAEDHARRSSMGPTMLAIWQREFLRLRDGDRFHFRAKGHFSKDQLKISRAREVLKKTSNVFRDILLRNTRISQSEIPRKMFFV